MHQDLYSILKKEKSLKKIITNLESTQIIYKHWDDIFGNLSKNLTLGYFKNGILSIEADNPVWVTEIDYFKPDLLTKIQVYLGKYKKILDIKISFKKRTESSKGIQNENKKEKKEPSIQNLSFEKAIQNENNEKKRQGYQLCKVCQSVLVPSGECVFCKNKTTLPLKSIG